MARKDKKQKRESMVEEKSHEPNAAEQEGQQQTVENTENESAQAGSKTTVDDKVETLLKENNELKDKYLRLRAEFDNFRKRTLKEKLDDKKLAKRDIMTELLPILDDFDRASKIALDNKTVESISEGMRLVHQKFINTLTQQGLEVMESGQIAFDPEVHEAIAEIPAPTEEMKGKVIDTVEKGYKLNGIIIRHPKVVVGR